MMVAEFVTRGQSGSPINGEIPSLNSNMPGSQGRELSGNPPAGYIREDIVLGPVSPGGSSADGFPSNASNFELAAHIKRKELFSQRKQREFIPDNKKDDNYWDRRRRNNEAAKRSREKRRFNDMVLERRVVELTKENHVLKAQLEAIKEEYGICGENIVCVEKIMASLPTSEQVLSITKRPKLSSSSSPGALLFQTSPSPIPTPVIHQPVSHPVIGSSPPPTVGHGMHLHHPHATETYQHPHPHSHHDTDTYHRGPPYYQPFSSQYEHSSPILVSNNNNDALNLCSRSRARSRSHSSSRVHSPFEVSSGNGSGDESCVPLPLTLAPTQQTSTPAAAQDSNNSLPLKLRHKSHLGDKDAASALLSLQNIKQEPGPRASPPWDEGSSDERDSGISLGSEWPASSAAAVAAVAAIALHKQSHPEDVDSENKHRLHSEIVRLSTEVANLKSLVIRNKTAVKQSPPQH